MHHEPANQAPAWTYPIWRLHAAVGAGSSEAASGFDIEMHTTARVFGWGFVVVLSATVGFLIWRQLLGAIPPTGPSVVAPKPVPRATLDGGVAPSSAPSVSASSVPRTNLDLSAFAGSLRPGVDPTLGVADAQGVLEVIGPVDVTVEVDGVDQGALPLTLVLEQGRHVVQYRTGTKSTYRFYYVKSGATRALRVVTRHGGLVDAR